MFTYKDINTIKGLLYAASCTKSSNNPQEYRLNFDQALNAYFSCYPNYEESDEPYQSPDDWEDE